MSIHRYNYITKKVGEPIIRAEDMLWCLEDVQARWMLGTLLDTLMAKGYLTESEAYAVSHDNDRWFKVVEYNPAEGG